MQTFHAVGGGSGGSTPSRGFPPMPPSNNKVRKASSQVECEVCKKKFKNETSKNYHEMFHTQEERDEANGSFVGNSKSREDSNSDTDSEAMESSKAKKVAGKVKETTKKAAKEPGKTKPEIAKAEPAKVLKKRFSEASEDSDNACDSNYLSLKHISMSIKKQDERRGAKEVASNSSTPKPIQKPTEPIPPTAAALSKAKPQLKPQSEALQKPEQKPVTKQKPKAVPSEPLPPKKVKLTCDQCKKKFSEIMALEYHKITFHADAAPSPPTPVRATPLVKTNKPVPTKVLKDQKVKKPNSKVDKESEDSDSESDSDEGAAPNTPEPEMKRYADEKNKLSALSGIFNKKRFSSSSSEPVKKVKDILKFKTDKKESTTRMKPVVKPKKVLQKIPKRNIYTDSESESETEQKSKPAAKSKTNLKKPDPSTTGSDSEPARKPVKPVKTKPKVVAKPKKPEEDDEEKVSSSDEEEEKEKYKKVPCHQCGRQMANEFVLQYHLVRCPGTTLAEFFSLNNNNKAFSY